MATKKKEVEEQNETNATYNKASNECPAPNGILMIIGGKESKRKEQGDEMMDENRRPLEVLQTFVELIDKKNPVIELITTASSVGEELIKEYREAFSDLGVQEIRHIHHTDRKQVLEDDLADRIKEADAIFFSGGDQLLLTSLYGGTSFLTRLKERYINEKIVVGGTSAGAMALSTPMIFAGNQEVQEIAGAINITTGLEFLKDVCVDTHFVNRSRFVRMAQVIATNPTCIGLGVDEDTALIIRNGLNGEVIGTGIITIIDGFFIANTNITEFSEKNALSIHNLKVHLLARGDRYSIPQINPPHK